MVLEWNGMEWNAMQWNGMGMPSMTCCGTGISQVWEPLLHLQLASPAPPPSAVGMCLATPANLVACACGNHSTHPQLGVCLLSNRACAPANLWNHWLCRCPCATYLICGDKTICLNVYSSGTCTTCLAKKKNQAAGECQFCGLTHLAVLHLLLPDHQKRQLRKG